MKVDALPKLLWRIIGLFIFATGLVVFMLGSFSGLEFFIHILNKQYDSGVMNFAIFFALLSGLGAILVFSGFGLLFIDRPVSKLNLVPWQVLIVSGALIAVSVVVFGAVAAAKGVSIAGAESKGFAMILGLAFSFIASGWHQRQKRERRLFK